MSAQQVYAVIKARSKYSYQQPRSVPHGRGKGVAIPFPVTFTGDRGGYCVSGNSNQYRIEDCNFFVRVFDDAASAPGGWPFVNL